MSSESEFAFIGGHLCLDFVNTAGGATKTRDVDRLPNFGEVVHWARRAGLIISGEERSLRSLGQAHPTQAADHARAIRAQRDAMYRVLEAMAEKVNPSPNDLLRVEEAIKRAFAASHLATHKSNPCAWAVNVDDVGMDIVRHRIALAMGLLLISDDRLNIRACEACSWLFLDPSPTKRRRWCSMAACGNRAKSRRHYHGHPARR